MLERADEYLKMHQMEQSLWWYKHLHALVLRSIKSNFKSLDVAIIDAGCGTGGMMDFLKNAQFHDVSGFDLSDNALELCRSKGHKVFSGSLQNISDYYPQASADVIISNDTLCYLNDLEIRNLFKNFHTTLKPGGLLIMNVPALKAFSGTHDIAVGIKQRFSKRKILSFTTNGWNVEENFYWPVLLSPMIYVARKWSLIKNKFSNNIISSDVKPIPDFLNNILFQLVKFEASYFKMKPFGSSFYFVLTKKSKQNEL